MVLYMTHTLVIKYLNIIYYPDFYKITFTDTNECSKGLSDCDLSSTTCINTRGGYRCNCKQGFKDLDGISCRSKCDEINLSYLGYSV